MVYMVYIDLYGMVYQWVDLLNLAQSEFFHTAHDVHTTFGKLVFLFGNSYHHLSPFSFRFLVHLDGLRC